MPGPPEVKTKLLDFPGSRAGEASVTYPVSGILLRQEKTDDTHDSSIHKNLYHPFKKQPNFPLGGASRLGGTMETPPPLLPWWFYVLTFFLILLIGAKTRPSVSLYQSAKFSTFLIFHLVLFIFN